MDVFRDGGTGCGCCLELTYKAALGGAHWACLGRDGEINTFFYYYYSRLSLLWFVHVNIMVLL